MAIFTRNRNSDEPAGGASDVREQLQSPSDEQKQVHSSFAHGLTQTNTFSPVPESLLSFSFKASSHSPEPAPAPAAVAPQVAGHPSRAQEDQQSPDEALAIASDATEPNDLIIRRGVTLKGELTSCDRVAIQGYVEASVTDCGKLEVMEGGIFKGSASVIEAEIAGHFDGVLRVEGKLVAHAFARISGTIQYGRLIVHDGAMLRARLEDISPADVSGHDIEQSAPSVTSEAAE